MDAGGIRGDSLQSRWRPLDEGLNLAGHRGTTGRPRSGMSRCSGDDPQAQLVARRGVAEDLNPNDAADGWIVLETLGGRHGHFCRVHVSECALAS